MSYSKHNHGGQLTRASQQYGIALADWLDLSTGINPNPYPLPQLPARCWQRLPESNDGLEAAAQAYYGSAFLLPVAGSQEAINALPDLLDNHTDNPRQVGIIQPAYHSHQQAWQQAGHNVILLDNEAIDNKINLLDILIIVNPCNPNAHFFAPKKLLEWHKKLAQRGGTLIIDEAFIDATPGQSLIRQDAPKGLIVLRSIGKFFGLAGIRLGFVWAEEEILNQLEQQQNDWAVSHPARWAGIQALQDVDWQQAQREQLPKQAQRLADLLEALILTKPPKRWGVYFNSTNKHVLHTALFAYFKHPRAAFIHQQLARQGVLTRLFTGDHPALRFGFPATEDEWRRLSDALENIKL